MKKWGILMVGVKKKGSGVEREVGGKRPEQLLFPSANCGDTNLTNAIWNRLQVDRPN